MQETEIARFRGGGVSEGFPESRVFESSFSSFLNILVRFGLVVTS